MNGVFEDASPDRPSRRGTGVAGLGVLLIAIALQLMALGRPACGAGVAGCGAAGHVDPAAAQSGDARAGA